MSSTDRPKVKRFMADTYLGFGGEPIMKQCVLAADYDALEADRDDAILTAFMLAEECDYTVMMEGAFFEVEEFIDKWREHVKELRDAK